MRSVLRDREFLRYFASRQLSVAGSIVTLVTLPIIVYRTSGSASQTALVAAAEAAPYLLFGLFSGALTDRWNRKKVMVAADVVSAVLVATIPLADLFWHLTVPHVLAVAFLGPTVGVFFDGAVFGALPMLVGRERIAEANSVAWAAASVVEMVMPSVVGVLLAFLHPAWLLGFDALTFVLSAVLIAGITRPMYDAARERPPLTARQIGRDIREGLDYLVHHPGVRTFTIIGFLQCVGAGGFVALMVVWIDQRLDIGTEGLRFGLVFGAWGVGGLAASLALPWLVRRVAAARIALTALPVAAVVGVAVPFITTWWAAGISLIAWGVFYRWSSSTRSPTASRSRPSTCSAGSTPPAGCWRGGWAGRAALSLRASWWAGSAWCRPSSSCRRPGSSPQPWRGPRLCEHSSRARRTGLLVRKIRQRALPLARAEVAPRHLTRERQCLLEVGVPPIDPAVVRRQHDLVIRGEGR